MGESSMNMKRLGLLFASLLTILIVVSSAFAFSSKGAREAETFNPASKVEGVSPELRDGVLRVVVSTDGTATFNAFVLGSPCRIVVDFPGLRNEFGAKAILGRGTAVERIRVGQPQAGTVRVVLDLVREVKYTVAREGSAVVISIPDNGGIPLSEPIIRSKSADTPGPAVPRAARIDGVALTPRVEIFGGYQYVRTDGPFSGDHNAAGWTAAVSTNFNKYLGLTTEFSGHWGSPGFTDFKSVTFPASASGNLNYRTYGFMGGPRFTIREGRVTTYGHALFGFGHIRYNKAQLTRFLALLEPGRQPSSFSSNSFAAAFGGGVDVRLSPAVSLRVIQAEYLLTHFRDLDSFERHNQHNIRVSTGIVFRLGEARGGTR
jgi:hypothetical protein